MNSLNLQLINLQYVNFQNLEPSLLAIFLLKARSFEGVHAINLRALNITKDFPSEMAQNFALFPNLTSLQMDVNLIDIELSREFLAKFAIGPSLRKVDIILNNLHFPNPYNCEQDAYKPFHNFAQNLSSAANVEDLQLRFKIKENFRGINNLIAHLPMSLSKIKKLSLEFCAQEGINPQIEDIRISMKPLLQWILSMPQLETFKLEALNKDYTGLSSLVVPQVLNWKTFIIGKWSEESQDTIKPNDFNTLMEILMKAQKLERLSLYLEASQFNLDAYKVLIKSIQMLKDLRDVHLKLNCKKISLSELELIEPALAQLKELKGLILVFIVDPMKDMEIWRHKLCKSFEKFQQLDIFDLALFGQKKPIFTQSYSKGKQISNFYFLRGLSMKPNYSSLQNQRIIPF